jgi:uncharacterized protein YdaU (DUF1376 family)
MSSESVSLISIPRLLSKRTTLVNEQNGRTRDRKPESQDYSTCHRTLTLFHRSATFAGGFVGSNKKMNFYSFHLGDYAAHTKHLNLMEDLAYRRMLDLYYTSEKPLPPEPEKVARLIGMRDYMQEVSDVLSDFFLKSEAGYTNKRCDNEIELYKAKAERAKAANKSRWEAQKYESVLISDVISDTDKLPTKNQEPRTNNQEPRKDTNQKQIQKPPAATAPVPVNLSDKAATERLLQAGRNVWTAYSTAYTELYKTPPVQNAKVRSLIKMLVQRIGEDEAPPVAAFYVNLKDKFYSQKRHPVDLLLKDAEGIRTQWFTGNTTTVFNDDRRQLQEQGKKEATARAYARVFGPQTMEAVNEKG